MKPHAEWIADNTLRCRVTLVMHFAQAETTHSLFASLCEVGSGLLECPELFQCGFVGAKALQLDLEGCRFELHKGRPRGAHFDRELEERPSPPQKT